MSGARTEAKLDVRQAPIWAWVLAYIMLGGLLVFSGVLTCTVAWQLDRAGVQEHRSLFAAGALARIAEQGGDDAAQSAIDFLAQNSPDLVEAFVITPGSRDSYGISRGHRYGASLDVGDRGQLLAPLATADPAKAPRAPRHKVRIDRFSRVIAGLSVKPKPGRALPTLALGQGAVMLESQSLAVHAAQVPVRRQDPGSAGATFKDTVPPSGPGWGLTLLLLLVVPLIGLGAGLLRPLSRTKWTAPCAGAFVTSMVLMTLVCAGGLGWHYERALSTHVEVLHDDARTVLKAAVAAGLPQAEATALVLASDVDFTGAPGLLYGSAAHQQRADGPARVTIEKGGAGTQPFGRQGALWSLVLFALLLGLGHRFIIRALVACRANPYAYGYVLPSLIGMGVLVFIPFLTGVGLSVFAYDAPRYYYTGLGNFAEILLGSKTGDVSFYWTLFSTLLWTVSNVVLHAVIGLGLALLLKDPALRFKKYYRVLLIIPWAIPNYITALIWKGMFNKEFGAVNRFIEAFQTVLGMDPSGVDWLGGSFATAFTANLVTNTWLGFPFMMVVSLGALQSIPGALYDAADVDGASAWQKFRHITLPLLKPALFPAIILGSIWTFNMFNVIYLVSGGGPDHSTEILITDAYRAFAELNRYGLAAAYSVIIFVILFLYTVMTNRITKATEGAFE